MIKSYSLSPFISFCVFNYSSSHLSNKIPCVFLDADGVLKYGNEPIPKAKEAIDLLR